MVDGREAEAVAARLKAFQADPARIARHYTDGLEPLLDGAIVLRFAQGRIPSALAPSAPEAHQLRCAAAMQFPLFHPALCSVIDRKSVV